MTSKATNPEEYIEQLPEDRQLIISKLRAAIKDHLPEGFQEGMSYGMIAFDVPHSLYPAGYHAKPESPLPFIHIASQKNHIALYHMGIYTDKTLMGWFLDEYKKVGAKKIDMGKSCIRFKPKQEIPYQLIGVLASKMTPQEWINLYEQNIKRK